MRAALLFATLIAFVACHATPTATQKPHHNDSAASRNAESGKQGKSPTTDLDYRLEVEFRDERPGDGSPTLHFRQHFTNRSDSDVYLPVQGGGVLFRSIGPEHLFKINTGKTHPSTYEGVRTPPMPADLLKVPAGKTAMHAHWQWLDALSLNYDDKEDWAQYIFRKPGTVRVSPCFSTYNAYPIAYQSLLPKGATLWQGELCGPPVDFRVKAVSKQAAGY